ncbi:MAG: hypothetical protein M1828_006102 [Chrysothrix sp. TS-e1954]|nr:MAG: hypothetical protein M1828_006102 [Chrysothrix sp. TS-e1954]
MSVQPPLALLSMTIHNAREALDRLNTHLSVRDHLAVGWTAVIERLLCCQTFLESDLERFYVDARDTVERLCRQLEMIVAAESPNNADKVKTVTEIARWIDRVIQLLMQPIYFEKDLVSNVQSIMPFRLSPYFATSLAMRNLVMSNDEDQRLPVPETGPNRFLESLEGTETVQRMRYIATGTLREQEVMVRFKEADSVNTFDNPLPEWWKRLCLQTKLGSQVVDDSSAFRALKCVVVEPCYHDRPGCILGFEMLPNCTSTLPPISLNQCWQSPELPPASLEERWKIAHGLAQAIFQFHSVRWSHRSIHSGNVFFGRKPPTKKQIPGSSILEESPSITPHFDDPYLYGTDTTTSKPELSDGEKERDSFLYHCSYSPWLLNGEADDVYSLGVLLLEVGMWRSALPMQSFREVDINGLLDISIYVRNLAESELRPMGSAYTGAVLACLDDGLIEPPEEGPLLHVWTDQIRRDFNVAFLEKVVWVLDRGTSS